LKAANRTIPAGIIVEGDREIGIRTLGAFTSLEQIRQSPILAPSLFLPALPAASNRSPEPPHPLTIGDVAMVYESVAPVAALSRVNGRDSVSLIITKVSDANTVTVVSAVKDALRKLSDSLPPDTQQVISRDDSLIVGDALEDVNATLLLGALLAMTVVFLFLHNLRGTFIIALALPACLVATYLVMYFANFTLNQMTLLALSLSVGILIDDSIVVLESILRHLGRGETPAEAAFNGRTEIGFADITTTLVDVVVFLPIGFMGGIVGGFFRQFGLTIVFATLFSLLVSFTITPSLAARWYRHGEDPEHVSHGVFLRLERVYAGLEKMYRHVIRWALRQRGWVIALAATALAAALLFTTPSLGFEFLPATDQGQIALFIELPPDSSLGRTDRIVRDIERRIADTPDVLNYVTTVGEILGGFGSIPQRGAQYAQINVRLVEKAGLLERLTSAGARDKRRRTDSEVAKELRERLKDVADAQITVSPVQTVASEGPPVQIQLRGSDLAQLGRVSEQVRDRIKTMPGILDPNLSVRSGRPEAQVTVDRVKAAALGQAPALVGAALRDTVEGNSETTYRDPKSIGTELPIRVQIAPQDRRDPKQLENVPIAYQGAKAVMLGQLAKIGEGIGPAAISRANGERMVTVTANLAAGYPLGNAEQDIRARIADIPREGIDLRFGGEAEVLAENTVYFALAIGLAIVLVYLVMASLFNSLLNPFIIMFTLPMALVGALGALAITGETLSLVAVIGIIMLIGLMGRNAILLIDYTATLRARGAERDAALIEAGTTRLRPILMTTLATIFGMLPVALRIGRASEQRAPMAVVVIGGLLLSTLLTLVVIPVLYTLFDDLRMRLSRSRKHAEKTR
jgi:HAE1 family hydrophobic/amphiphilic exporter-1